MGDEVRQQQLYQAAFSSTVNLIGNNGSRNRILGGILLKCCTNLERKLSLSLWGTAGKY